MKVVLISLLLLITTPAFAVQPDEVLTDPALEARARAISALLRCPVCQGENIDESNAPVARDLRLAVRERLTAGDSDEQVVDYVTARFGEFVLFDPPKKGVNLILWGAGPALMLLGLLIAVTTLRRRPPVTGPDVLTTEESKRLDDLMKD